MDKQALRNKRLDEIEEEEGMLGTERMHGAGERGEMLDDPEVAFEPEEDEEISLLKEKKDMKERRLQMIRDQHKALKDAPKVKAPESIEDVYEDTIPDGGETKAEEVAELFEEKPEAIALMTGEEAELEDRKQGVDSDDAFDKNLFLPLEEIRILAPTFADDYGYTGEESYVMPASAQSRSELKGLLIRIYEGLQNRTGGKVDKSGRLENELKEVDTLNDLEIRHALNYYKKIDILERKKGKKAQTLRENEESEE